MILPTFTDREKEWEAVRICDYAYEVAMDYIEEMGKILFSRKHFPAYERICFTDDKHNDWRLVFFIPSKEYAKKRLVGDVCYTTYEIPAKRCKNQTNAGKGVILFSPIELTKRLKSKETQKGSFISEYVPHAINRFTERYLIPNGLVDLDIHKKVEKLITRNFHFDILADKCGDISAKKHFEEKGGICSYDVVTKEGGLLRGSVASGFLVRFYTYIPPKMLHDSQMERIAEMTREKHRWKNSRLDCY